MKKFLFLNFILFFASSIYANKNCFLVKENNLIIKQEGDCELRHAPCSTFKIVISLIAYNEELLIDETHPELPFKEGYLDYIERWKQPHNPSLWMKNSCVWYSQVLTQKLGMEKFKEYVIKFNYGNHDVSGDKGKNNGLTNSWLSSSLEISPKEQILFLENFINNKLPISAKAHEMTKNILFIDELADGWELYGKSGSGCQLNHDRTQKLELQIGWFIGWIQKDNRTIIFVYYIEDEDLQETYAGIRARAAAKEKLLELIQ